MRYPKGVCFDVLDDGVGGTSPTPSRPGEPARPRKITCEFCECELGNSGEYKRLSEKAKGYRDAEERIERLQAELVSARAEITAAKATPAPTREVPRTSGGISM